MRSSVSAMDTSQLLKGVLPTTALAVIAAGDTYGYQVLHRLRSAGLETVGDASVYGTLQRLYDTGLLSSYMAPSDAGPSRRYYAISAQGHAALKQGQERWAQFEAVVSGLLEPQQGVKS